MTSVVLIFPHQLFKQHPALYPDREVYLIEYSLFFDQYDFHKQKLLLHRSTMKYYEQYLIAQGYKVHYVDCHEKRSDLNVLFEMLCANGVIKICYADTVDYMLERRLRRYSIKHELAVEKSESPNFILSKTFNERYFSENKFFLKDYYINIRRELNVMMDGGKPMGGQWTFDTDNRKKIPKGTTIPKLPMIEENEFVKEARVYVNQHFQKNYGNAERFYYPTTHSEAELWLEDF